MRTNKIIPFLSLLLLTAVGSFSMNAQAADNYDKYKALDGLKGVSAVVDFRIAKPQMASMMLGALLQTFKDKAINDLAVKPMFTVVFIGPSVKLVSTDRTGFKPEDNKSLDAIAKTVSEMTSAGIRFELCNMAAEYFKVDVKKLLPGITPVANGFISVIGYQNQGNAVLVLDQEFME